MNNERIRFLKIHLLQQNMVFWEQRWLIGFSHRSASTLLSRIFLSHLGYERDANEREMWISDYRERILLPQWRDSLTVDRLLSVINDPNMLRIKFVRNPFSRLVSAFVHCFRLELRPDRRHLNPFRADLSKPIEGQLDLSFREFVRALASFGTLPGKCNSHYSQQKMIFEGNLLNYKHICKVEDLRKSFSDLALIDSALPVLSEEYDKQEQANHKSRFIDRPYACVADVPFSQVVELIDGKERFPPYSHFFDRQLRDQVIDLYQGDFEAYNYDWRRIPNH